MEIDWCPSDKNVCRLNSQFNPADLRKRLGDSDWLVWQEGNELTFAYRGNSSQIHLGGAFQTTLMPIADSDIWAVSVRVNRLDEAIIRHWLYIYQDHQQTLIPQTLGIWRGARAPAAPAYLETLEGEIREAVLYSDELGEDRNLTCYLPAEYSTSQTYSVIYLTDGDMFTEFGFPNVVEPLIKNRIVPPVVLVAVHAAPFRMTHDRRGEEYVPGYSDESYRAHERFFTESVRIWAEQNLPVSREPRCRAIMGYSRGAVFAGNASLNKPGIYRHVMMFSPGDELPVDKLTEIDTHYYLLAGTLEEHFLEATTCNYKNLRRVNANAVFVQRVAGHTSTLWVEEFPRALKWMFDIEN